MARISLMTLILLSPALARTTVNSVFSSAGGGGRAAGGRASGHGDGGGGDAPLLLELLHELSGLHDGEGGELSTIAFRSAIVLCPSGFTNGPSPIGQYRPDGFG